MEAAGFDSRVRPASAIHQAPVLVGAAPERGSAVILAANARWIAPGHNSIIRDESGQDWIVYHAVDARRPRAKPTDDVNTRRVMLIDRIVWRNGWPQIENRSPSTAPRARPAGRWR